MSINYGCNSEKEAFVKEKERAREKMKQRDFKMRILEPSSPPNRA